MKKRFEQGARSLHDRHCGMGLAKTGGELSHCDPCHAEWNLEREGDAGKVENGCLGGTYGCARQPGHGDDHGSDGESQWRRTVSDAGWCARTAEHVEDGAGALSGRSLQVDFVAP